MEGNLLSQFTDKVLSLDEENNIVFVSILARS